MKIFISRKYGQMTDLVLSADVHFIEIKLF